MLQPMRTKFRKAHKGRIKGLASSAVDLAFGQFGLKAMEPERVTARQIEAARRALTRHMKRSGRVWIRLFPDVPVSKKPLEVRMGSGKGTPEYWVARVKPGRILFEVDGVTAQIAKEALTLAAAKLPIKTRFVERISEQPCHESSRRPSNDPRSDRRRGAQAEEGAVQSAFSARHWTIGEYRPRARGEARHCAAENHRAAQARPGEKRGRHEGGDRAHFQGHQASGRLDHPLRPQRRGADQSADGAGRHPHFRTGAARPARQEPHEDHFACARGAVMAAKIKKGDTVVVVAGRDKGRTGEVIEMRPAEARALVRGVNMVKRHQKQSTTQEGGIISKEAPVHLSNIALADPKDGKPTRVGFKFVGTGEQRKKVRFAKRSGVEIDG